MSELLKKYGFVVVHYALVKLIGAVPAFLYGRLFSEFAFAKKNNYLSKEGCFVTSFDNLVDVGLSLHEISYALDTLQNKDFIYFKNLKDGLILISLNEDTLLDFVEAEKSKKLINWSWNRNLNSVQKNIWKFSKDRAFKISLYRAKKYIQIYTNNNEIQELFLRFLLAVYEMKNWILSNKEIQKLISWLDENTTSDDEKVVVLKQTICGGYTKFFLPYELKDK